MRSRALPARELSPIFIFISCARSLYARKNSNSFRRNSNSFRKYPNSFRNGKAKNRISWNFLPKTVGVFPRHFSLRAARRGARQPGREKSGYFCANFLKLLELGDYCAGCLRGRPRLRGAVASATGRLGNTFWARASSRGRSFGPGFHSGDDSSHSFCQP